MQRHAGRRTEHEGNQKGIAILDVPVPKWQSSAKTMCQSSTAPTLPAPPLGPLLMDVFGRNGPFGGSRVQFRFPEMSPFSWFGPPLEGIDQT